MKLNVDENLLQNYPELQKRLEQLLVDSMNVRDAQGKRILGPIEIDLSDTIKGLVKC